MVGRRCLPQPLPWPPCATQRWAVPSIQCTSKSTEACPRLPGTTCVCTLVNGENTALRHRNLLKRLSLHRLASHAGFAASRGFDRLVKFTRVYRALALCLRVTTCLQPIAAALNKAVSSRTIQSQPLRVTPVTRAPTATAPPAPRPRLPNQAHHTIRTPSYVAKPERAHNVRGHNAS